MKKALILAIFLILLFNIVSFADSTEVEVTINYYRDGEMFKSDKILVPVDDPTVTTVDDYTPEGYVLDEESSTPLPFMVTDTANVVNIYYEKKTFTYRVVYFLDGNSLNDDLVATTDSTNVVNEVPYNNIPEGAEVNYNNSTTLPVEITENNQVISVYYSTSRLKYTVKYYKDGESMNADEKGEVNLRESSTVDSVPDKTPEGYKISDKSTLLPFEVTRFNNVISVYYEPEEIKYTIKYYKDGEDMNIDISGSVTGKNNKISTVPNKAPDGYQIDTSKSTKLPFSVTKENNTISIYYSKNILKYKVIYYKDGAKMNMDIEDSVGTDSPKIKKVPDKKPIGYKINKEKSTKLPFTVTKENNVIKVYYEKDILEYKVIYYKDGDVYDEVIIKNRFRGDIINEVDDRTPEGYKIDENISTKLPFKLEKQDSVIRIYYISSESSASSGGASLGIIILIFVVISALSGGLAYAYIKYSKTKKENDNKK